MHPAGNRSPQCTKRWSAGVVVFEYPQDRPGATKELLLAGQVAAVTGGAGAIGAATAKAFAPAGAEIAIVDVDEAAGRRHGDRRRCARCVAT